MIRSLVSTVKLLTGITVVVVVSHLFEVDVGWRLARTVETVFTYNRWQWP